MELRVLGVKSDGNDKVYDYITYDSSIKIGDSVIVGVYGNTDFGDKIKIVTVAEDNTAEVSPDCKKMILSKIDLTEYVRGREYENKREVLMERARERYEKISEIMKWRTMAQNDSKMKKLIEDIDRLDEAYSK